MSDTAFRRQAAALISTDFGGLHAYKTRRDRMKKLEELEDDINNIKQDMTEIKTLLQKILINRG